jgi:hypothetical protein
LRLLWLQGEHFDGCLEQDYGGGAVDVVVAVEQDGFAAGDGQFERSTAAVMPSMGRDRELADLGLRKWKAASGVAMPRARSSSAMTSGSGPRSQSGGFFRRAGLQSASVVGEG